MEQPAAALSTADGGAALTPGEPAHARGTPAALRAVPDGESAPVTATVRRLLHAGQTALAQSRRPGRHPMDGSAPPLLRGWMTPQPWRLGRAPAAAPAAPDGPHSTFPSSFAPPTECPMPASTWEAAAQRRRWALVAAVVMSAFTATMLVAAGLPWGGGWRDLGLVLQLALFALLFAWVAAGCVTAVMGAWVLWRGDAHTLSRHQAISGPLDRGARTAVVMPVRNEDVATVFAGLRATCESLAATDCAPLFDVYVLSDSSDPDARVAEVAAWSKLRRALAGRLRIHYRWRQRQVHRKAGNIADFCRRWGRLYRYMVVLDADSVMTGDCLATLVRLMEGQPQAGIIQTAPQTWGHDTLHARAQQFAGRVTGRLFTAGMQFWQLGESHYWGHNAIIRIAPFMQHCALARLPGSGPLAGEVLSHDFIEAALMRRAGYHVWLVRDLPGSYEQLPPDLLEELKRDRRWCQGNLQNARLLGQPGLHPVHRAMLGTGAMAYASAPLWLAFVLLGLGLALASGGSADGLHAGPLLTAAPWLATAALLALPRVLGVATVWLRDEARFHGGRAQLVLSALLEAGWSVVLAPIRMMAHTLFVVGALTGWSVDWTSPPRGARQVRWTDALHQAAPGMALAGAMCLLAALLQPAALAWLLPVALPLLIAAPLMVWGSRTDLGQALRERELLLIPEESWAPAVLRRTAAEAELAGRQPGWADLLGDAALADTVAQAMGQRHTLHGVRGRDRRGLLQHVAARRAHVASGGEGADASGEHTWCDLCAISPRQRLRLLSEPQHLLALRQLLQPSRSRQPATGEQAG